MRQIRTISRRSLLALFCSLLMTFQPVLSASDSSVVGSANSSGHIPISGTLVFSRNMAAAIVAALPFFSHGEPANPPESIAMAKLTGTADRNGQPLLNGSIVSSGDSLCTHGDSALLLTSSPRERVWLGPNTNAKLSKDAGTLAVALVQGTVTFETQGQIRVSIENHGLTLRNRPGTPVLAQLSLVNNQEAKVRVQEGSLELVEGIRSVPLVSSSGTRPPDQSMTSRKLSAQEATATQPGSGSITGSVVSSELYVVSGANVTLTNAAGKTFTATSDPDGKFAFSDVPAGTYTLRVNKAGFKNYELKDVVVRAGNESSLYVHLGGGVGQKKSNNLLLWVIVGGVAAVGIGVGLGLKGSSSSSNSPSTVQ